MLREIAETPINGLNSTRIRTDCNGSHRIVALEKVAGSSPVGHPPEVPANVLKQAQRSGPAAFDEICFRYLRRLDSTEELRLDLEAGADPPPLMAESSDREDRDLLRVR
jgi:hypothetical protein